jgi:chemotaxis protein MotB
VLKFFEDAGFNKKLLTAVGYGEARPVVPNRDAQGNPIVLNQTQNRRVVIKMLKRSQTPLGVDGQVTQDGSKSEAESPR